MLRNDTVPDRSFDRSRETDSRDNYRTQIRTHYCIHNHTNNSHAYYSNYRILIPKFILLLHGFPLGTSQNHINTTLTTLAACLPECTER